LPDLYLVPSTLTSSEQNLAQLEMRYPEFDVRPLQGGLYRLLERAPIVNSNQNRRRETPAEESRPSAPATNGTVTGSARG